MRVGAAIRTVAAAAHHAEALLGPSYVFEEFREVRSVIALSPLGSRMQHWPRGYVGDFETVESIIRQQNKAEKGTLGFLIEQEALACPICQQHRNKIVHQARLIALLAESGPKRILLLASGSALDIEFVWFLRSVRKCEFILCDVDGDALDRARESLGRPATGVATLKGNVLSLRRRITELGPFDLVIAGGLFDYFPDSIAKTVIRMACGKWLRDSGVFYFSNIVKGNPYRAWMQYLENWNVIERTAEDIDSLMECVKDQPIRYKHSRDATGLTLLVESTRSN